MGSSGVLRIAVPFVVGLFAFTACGREDAKIRVEAKLDKKLARVFEPVRLDVVVSNVGKEDVKMHFSSPHVMFTISLTDPSGEAVPRSAYGKMRADLDSEGANSSGTIAAGGSYTVEVTEFVRCFDLSKDGKYSLVVSCAVRDAARAGGFVRVSSEAVLLEVVENDDSRPSREVRRVEAGKK